MNLGEVAGTTGNRRKKLQTNERLPIPIELTDTLCVMLWPRYLFPKSTGKRRACLRIADPRRGCSFGVLQANP
jgi:hypothetical protein